MTALFSVRPTKVDRAVADVVSAHTSPAIEQTAKVLTWGADEHVILLAAAAFWLYSRGAPLRQRKLSNHVLACMLATSALPHVLKTVIDQERPDRETWLGHLRAFHGRASGATRFPRATPSTSAR